MQNAAELPRRLCRGSRNLRLRFFAEQRPQRVDAERSAKWDVRQVQDRENQHQGLSPALSRIESPATDHARETEHAEKTEKGDRNDTDHTGCLMLALGNYDAAGHSHKNKYQHRAHQIERSGGYVERGNSLDMLFHGCPEILCLVRPLTSPHSAAKEGEWVNAWRRCDGE